MYVANKFPCTQILSYCYKNNKTDPYDVSSFADGEFPSEKHNKRKMAEEGTMEKLCPYLFGTCVKHNLFMNFDIQLL